MNLSALRNDLAELQVIRRELDAQADGLERFLRQLPQVIKEPEAVRQLQKQQQDLLDEADQALQLCRALEQIAEMVGRTEAILAQQPDSIHLNLTFAPPAETNLQLESQTKGIKITW